MKRKDRQFLISLRIFIINSEQYFTINLFSKSYSVPQIKNNKKQHVDSFKQKSS